jgi:hypothetical protein
MIKNLIAILTLSLLGLIFVERAPAASRDFQSAGAEIPLALQAKGYTRLGAIDLADFLDRMRSVEVRFSTQLSAAKRNQDGRISARWENRGNKNVIEVYAPSWNRFVEQRSMLALHEYLGVLGYEDENYWLSTQMWTLSIRESEALDNQERAAIERSIETSSQQRRLQMAANGGGVVGVGGGGEGGTVWLRQRQIKRGLEKAADPRGERTSAIGEVFDGLEGTSEVSYGNFWSPETKRQIKAMQARRKDYCMISAGLCKVRNRKRGDSSCICAGYGEDGTIISTEKPWKLLD